MVLGPVVTICARAFAPDKLGPGPVFPNLGLGVIQGLSNASFWVCLVCQLSICLVPFKFFRKQLLTMPYRGNKSSEVLIFIDRWMLIWLKLYDTSLNGLQCFRQRQNL
jgi:hypothetical protein